MLASANVDARTGRKRCHNTPSVGITRIRFQGRPGVSFGLPNPLSLSAPPIASDLDAKRTAAAATAGDVRVVELEPGAMESVDVVDLGAVHVEEARFVDENLQPVEFVDRVVLVVIGLVEAHAVLETGTSASNHLDAK